jgi:hypothetical protein
MKTPFNSHQLKEMEDMESIRVNHLYRYNVATSNTKDACRSLFSIIRDDDEPRLVLCDNA